MNAEQLSFSADCQYSSVMSNPIGSGSCASCGAERKVMKRCRNCRNILYCSKECQIKNWPTHREKCSLRESENTDKVTTAGFIRNYTPDKKTEFIETKVTVKCNHKKHIINLINVETSQGSEIMRQLSEQLHIPVNAMKVIGKGKMMDKDNIADMLMNRKCRTFQAFGEEAENEDGLDTGDIKAIMERLNVSRNAAIKSLRACNGDLIDAILDLGNKL